MSTTETYGTRSVPDMIAQVNELRRAIRAEGTPAVQDAWDKVEEHIDFAYRKPAPVATVRCPDCNDTGYCDGGRCWSCDIADAKRAKGGPHDG
jgi:hypothetical protein